MGRRVDLYPAPLLLPKGRTGMQASRRQARSSENPENHLRRALFPATQPDARTSMHLDAYTLTCTRSCASGCHQTPICPKNFPDKGQIPDISKFLHAYVKECLSIPNPGSAFRAEVAVGSQLGAAVPAVGVHLRHRCWHLVWGADMRHHVGRITAFGLPGAFVLHAG